MALRGLRRHPDLSYHLHPPNPLHLLITLPNPHTTPLNTLPHTPSVAQPHTPCTTLWIPHSFSPSQMLIKLLISLITTSQSSHSSLHHPLLFALPTAAMHTSPVTQVHPEVLADRDIGLVAAFEMLCERMGKLEEIAEHWLRRKREKSLQIRFDTFCTPITCVIEIIKRACTA